MRRAATAILLLFVLGACSQEAETYASPTEVVAALQEADLECSDLEMADPSTDTEPVDGAERESLIAEQGVCSTRGTAKIGPRSALSWLPSPRARTGSSPATPKRS
jgi:hypothetical protein